MHKFNTHLLEGVFFLGENTYPDSHGVHKEGFNDLFVKQDRETVSVYSVLQTLAGQDVQFAMYHLPSNPVDLNRWGCGSCLWEPVGLCPAGHKEHPHMLYNLSGRGVLVYDLGHSTMTGGWWLDQFDGQRVVLPMALMLPGHMARVAVATVLSVEQMRDTVLSHETAKEQVQDLKNLLSRLKSGK